MIKLTFIQSDERKYNIERSLSLIKSDIIAAVKDAKRVVVKPSCISSRTKETATHKDALDAVLGFIKPYVKSQIILADGCSTGETFDAFKNFGYLELQEKYDFTIVDLNNDEFLEVPLVDKNGKEWQSQVSKTLAESDYLISVCQPKTHDHTVYSGAIESTTTGSLLRTGHGFSARLASKMGMTKDNKTAILSDNKSLNENIKRLNAILPIRLAILDAFEAMEGDGPANGDIVPLHWAIATSNPIAADCLACTLMGINYLDVGYLSMLEDGKDEYFVAGDDWQKAIKKIKMPREFDKIRWQKS